MTKRPIARIASVTKQKMKPYLLLGFTLVFIHASTQQLHGQSTPAPATSRPSEFEVATIKPASVGSDGVRQLSLNVNPGGRVKVTNWTLKDLVHAAYGLDYWQIQGGPAWIDTDRFDVEAKPSVLADGAPDYNLHHDNWTLMDPNLRAMLQKLLEERFQLKIHLVANDGPIRVLERTDGALSLIPVKNSLLGFGGIGAGGYNVISTTMPELAAYISGLVTHEPVIDKTGLDGAYDFKSKSVMTQEDWANFTPALILSTLKEMGLKLTKSTGSVTTLVIDQASQPSAN